MASSKASIVSSGSSVDTAALHIPHRQVSDAALGPPIFSHLMLDLL